MTRAQLKSARLTLRPVVKTDCAAVVAALNDLRVARWLSSIPHPYGKTDFDHFFHHVAVKGKTFAVENMQGFVGICGVESQLGYWLVPQAWGQGFALEAARAVLADRFDANLGAVATYAFADNIPSLRILSRLGFVPSLHGVKQGEKQGVKMCRALGAARAHIEFTLNADQFRASNPNDAPNP